MADYDLPELPSDEELGITEEDREKYGDAIEDDGPELSNEEMAMLLGGSAVSGSDEPGKAPSKKDERAAKRAEKQRAKQRAKAEKLKAKAEKLNAKEEKRRAQAAARAAATPTTASAGGAAAGSTGDEGTAPTADAADGAGTDGAGTPPPSGDDRGGRGTPPAGPKALAPVPSWRGPTTFLLLVALSLFASTRTGQVRPGAANDPASVFSSARAMAVLADMTRAPHAPGSPEHARVLNLLVERLRDLGLDPEIQTATTLLERGGPVSGDPSYARAATVRNIVARLPGRDPSGTVLITAHYDSRGIAIGAGDDGSGVVTILEAIRALREGPPLRNDIIVLLTDAEELGLMGARAFVDRHAWMPDVDLVLSFEMRGSAGPSIMFETNERNGWVVRALQEFDPSPFANSMSYEIYRRLPNDTDFSPFRDAGVQGLNFAAIDNAHVYHQTYDDLDHLSPSTVQHHGERALAGLRHFGDADLTVVNDANVVFFNVPVLGLVVYRQLWVLPISGLLLLLFALTIPAARRASARPARMAAGTVLVIVVGAIAYGLANVAFQSLTPFHAEFGALQGAAFHSEGWYVLGIAFAALFLIVTGGILTRRWIAPLEMAVGALVLPLLVAIALGFVAPLGAMNLQWPVLAATVAVMVVALLGERASGLVGWFVSLALAVPVFLLLQPVLELVWLAMSIRLAGGLAVIAVVGFALCLPALAFLETPNAWWAPVSLGLLAAGSVAVGILTSDPSAERPAPSTLIYAYEHGTDAAMWITGELDGPGAEWARERAGADFGERRDLESMGYENGDVPTAPARIVGIAPPDVELVGDTVFADQRRVVLAVRSEIRAEMLSFQLEGETRLTAINGEPISNVDELRRVDHWGTPEDAVLLELSMPTGSPIDVHVLEVLLRPTELLGRDAFRRPPELAPNVRRQSDQARIRYSVARYVDPLFAGSDVTPVVTPPPDTGVPGTRSSFEPTLWSPVSIRSVERTRCWVSTRPEIRWIR